MEFLKKRGTAVIVFIVVVAAFTLLGSHRSLQKASDHVEQRFFTDENDPANNYYTCPGEQLGHCVKYANRLLAVLGNTEEYAAVYDELYAARLALDTALQTGDIAAAYDAGAALETAVNEAQALYAAGAALPPSNDDFDSIVSDFHSARALADRSGYNRAVDDFVNNTVNAFPTGLLRVLTGVSLPQRFA